MIVLATIIFSFWSMTQLLLNMCAVVTLVAIRLLIAPIIVIATSRYKILQTEADFEVERSVVCSLANLF